MNVCIYDSTLFFKRIEDNLLGVCAIHVDDILFAGDSTYSQVKTITEGKFRYKAME